MDSVEYTDSAEHLNQERMDSVGRRGQSVAEIETDKVLLHV